MEITEVRIKLMDESSERLQAFCSITFDDSFVIRDLKIIEGASGPFVAMPSRKLTAHCPQCGCKNHLRASFCNQCGARLHEDRSIKDSEGRTKLYADIAHPINSICREMIQTRVLEEFQAELERSKQPGYASRYEEYDDGEEEFDDPLPSPREKREVRPSAPARASAPRTQVEPPAQEPRPPHRAPTRQPGSRPPSRRVDTGQEKRPEGPNAEFGAGIF